MGINRKIKRNKKSPMEEVFIETVMSSVLSNKEQNITLHSYNPNFVNDAQDLLIKFNMYFTRLIFDSISKGKDVYMYEDYFGEIIKNNDSTMLLDYTVENDRILFENKLVGFNIGKLLFDDYIVYFAASSLFFEDTKTNKKYIHSKEMVEKEVA